MSNNQEAKITSKYASCISVDICKVYGMRDLKTVANMQTRKLGCWGRREADIAHGYSRGRQERRAPLLIRTTEGMLKLCKGTLTEQRLPELEAPVSELVIFKT